MTEKQHLDQAVTQLVKRLISDENVAGTTDIILRNVEDAHGKDSKEYREAANRIKSFEDDGIQTLDALEWWLARLATPIHITIGGVVKYHMNHSPGGSVETSVTSPYL